MKKLILSMVLLFVVAVFNASIPPKSSVAKKIGPIVYYGRAYIKGNRVDCMGGRRLCAVIPRGMDDEEPVSDGVIIVYNDGEMISDIFHFSSITVTPNADGGGTQISWLP